MQQGGYATGGIASNINLAESFGFDQGYDEYHYLAPDYLLGAKESSSKLILYQIARSVWFKIRPGLRVGDFYQPAPTVNAVAFDFLERHRNSRFFLFLHYMDPHDPYFEHPYTGKGIARVAKTTPPTSVSKGARISESSSPAVGPQAQSSEKPKQSAFSGADRAGAGTMKPSRVARTVTVPEAGRSAERSTDCIGRWTA